MGKHRERDIYQKLIEAVYRHWNHEKVDDVPRLMEKYKGQEADIYDKIVRKYVFTQSKEAWLPLILAMYKRFNPDKLNDMDHILEKYLDSEPALYRALCNKYIPGLKAGEAPMELDVWKNSFKRDKTPQTSGQDRNGGAREASNDVAPTKSTAPDVGEAAAQDDAADRDAPRLPTVSSAAPSDHALQRTKKEKKSKKRRGDDRGGRPPEETSPARKSRKSSRVDTAKPQGAEELAGNADEPPREERLFPAARPKAKPIRRSSGGSPVPASAVAAALPEDLAGDDATATAATAAPKRKALRRRRRRHAVPVQGDRAEGGGQEMGPAAATQQEQTLDASSAPPPRKSRRRRGEQLSGHDQDAPASIPEAPPPPAEALQPRSTLAGLFAEGMADGGEEKPDGVPSTRTVGDGASESQRARQEEIAQQLSARQTLLKAKLMEAKRLRALTLAGNRDSANSGPVAHSSNEFCWGTPNPSLEIASGGSSAAVGQGTRVTASAAPTKVTLRGKMESALRSRALQAFGVSDCR